MSTATNKVLSEDAYESFLRARSFARNSFVVGVLRDVLSGEVRSWTRWDWYAAVVRFPLLDARRMLATFLLDHTGALGREIQSEVLYRRSLAKATAIGSDCFCVFHDCDARDCPAGKH